MQHSLPKTTPVQLLASATMHQHHFQPSRESDVLAQSQNVAREEISTQLNPILQGIKKLLSDLRLDNQNIKRTIRSLCQYYLTLRHYQPSYEIPS